MRLIFISILFLFCFCSPSYSQNVTGTLDSIQKKLDTLSYRTDEKNYIRIPRSDFEQIISNKITDEIHSEMHEWQWVIGVVLAILGSLFLFYFKSQLKSEVNTSVTALKTEVNAGVEALKTEVTALKTDVSNSIDVQFKNRLGVFWDDLASSIIKRAEDHKFTGADIKASLEKLLNDKTILLQDPVKVKVIDALIYYYYYSDEKDKTQQMIKLVKTYESDLYLTTETYANLAIAFTGSYSLYGTKNDRINAIDYCDKSINRLPDYGTAYALKLEVFIIYYLKGTEEEKDEAIKLLKNTFHSIGNNGSPNLPVETIERLMLDKSKDVNERSNSIATLEKMFTPELNDMREKAVIYLMNNYAVIVADENQRYFKTLKSVIDFGLNSSPNLDGKWSATNFVTAGIDEIATNNEEIVFDTIQYTSKTNAFVKKGYVYFIPPEEGKIMAMDLFEMKKDVLSNTKKAIYSLENDTLQICYSPVPEQRPSEFTSTPENNYTLVTYKRSV